MMSWEFLLTSFVIVASPGTGVLVTISAGLSRGRRAALMAAIGGMLGTVPHMLAATTGLAAILHTSSVAFEVIRYAGVAYLLWMAWTTLRDSESLQIGQAGGARSGLQAIRSAVLVNILNPKLSIFFFAFLPQFVSPAAPHPVVEMLGLSLVFAAMTFLVFVLYGLTAAALRHQVASRPAVLAGLRRGFAAAFVGLGLKLALTER